MSRSGVRSDKIATTALLATYHIAVLFKYGQFDAWNLSWKQNSSIDTGKSGAYNRYFYLSHMVDAMVRIELQLRDGIWYREIRTSIDLLCFLRGRKMTSELRDASRRSGCLGFVRRLVRSGNNRVWRH